MTRYKTILEHLENVIKWKKHNCNEKEGNIIFIRVCKT